MRDGQVLQIARLCANDVKAWAAQQLNRHEKAMVAQQNMTVDTHLRLAALIECLSNRPMVRARLWLIPLPWKTEFPLTNGEVEDCFQALKKEFFAALKAKDEVKPKEPSTEDIVSDAERAASKEFADKLHAGLAKGSLKQYVEPVPQEVDHV